MKAAVLKGQKNFKVENLKDPVGRKGDVHIDVKYAGICGSDIHYWDMGEPVGLVLGHEFSGVVTNPGSRKDLKVGDRVTALPISSCLKCPSCLSGNVQHCRDTWTYGIGLSMVNPGAYAQKTFSRPDMVVKLPDNVTDQEAALVEPMAVCLHAVHRSNISVGSKVLVVGAGIIGLGCAMFAKMQGASYVAISDTNPGRGQKAVKLKVADEWIDAKDPNFAGLAVAKTGDGFDVVIDCCGNSAAVNSALMSVRPGGEVVLAGISSLPINFISVLPVMFEHNIKGAAGYTKQEFVDCIDMMASKQINVTKFISKVVGLNDTQKAYEELTNGTTTSVKILIDPNK